MKQETQVLILIALPIVTFIVGFLTGVLTGLKVRK